MRTNDDFEKLWNAKKRVLKRCPYCQCTVAFFKFKNEDKKLCKNCNRYVFKNDKTEFEYRLKEKILKR